MPDDKVRQPAPNGWQAIANARNYDVPDLRARQCLLQRRREILQYHNRRRTAVLQLMLELVDRIERIDIDDDHAGSQHTEQDDRRLQQIGQHYRHTVTALELQRRRQISGKLAASLIQLGETQAGTLIDDRYAISIRPTAIETQLGERSVTVGIDFEGYAFRVARVPGPVFHISPASRQERPRHFRTSVFVRRRSDAFGPFAFSTHRVPRRP